MVDVFAAGDLYEWGPDDKPHGLVLILPGERMRVYYDPRYGAFTCDSSLDPLSVRYVRNGWWRKISGA